MSKPISKKKEWVFRSILIVGSLFIALFLADLLMRSTGESSESTATISYNDSINTANKAFGDQNPYGFTDVVHAQEKPKGVYRIAVLGDSFIWGDGLPYEQAWSHKLQTLIEQHYRNVEVLHWGRNGWQTKQELAFYDTVGRSYDVDALILGYVDNDPDMGLFKHMTPFYREKFWVFYKLFPGLTASILDEMYARSYGNWQDRLHGEENLKEYAKLLKELKTTLDKDSINSFVVMTPACIYGCHPFYEVIKPTMDSVGFSYVDVHPICEEKLGHLPFDSIRANPSNFHPGPLMTQIFAEEAFKYMEENKVIPDSLLLP